MGEGRRPSGTDPDKNRRLQPSAGSAEREDEAYRPELDPVSTATITSRARVSRIAVNLRSATAAARPRSSSCRPTPTAGHSFDQVQDVAGLIMFAAPIIRIIPADLTLGQGRLRYLGTLPRDRPRPQRSSRGDTRRVQLPEEAQHRSEEGSQRNRDAGHAVRRHSRHLAVPQAVVRPGDREQGPRNRHRPGLAVHQMHRRRWLTSDQGNTLCVDLTGTFTE